MWLYTGASKRAKSRIKMCYLWLERKILNEIYHKENLTKNDISEVKDIFTKTNALKIAEQLAKNLLEQSRNHLRDIYPDLNRKEKVFFTIFSDFVYFREY